MMLAGPRWQPLIAWAPWTDRRGRLHPLRAVVFTLLMLPAGWLALRWANDSLGARPLNAAIHSTGYWAAWTFIASLLVTPVKSLLGMPNLVVVRRMIGNAALCYAVVHLLLYITDQNWRLTVVATEILVRAYLTIGFVTLLGLSVLGLTSTDGWVKRLGRNWKRLHKLAYGLAVLALLHFFLQSKVDVSQATVAAGVFAWAMIWRMLPAGRDRGPWPLIGLALAAGAMAALFEYAWYRFGTHVDPLRVLRGELDISFGLRPAGLVLLLGLLAAGVVELRALAQTRFGAGVGYTVLVYSLGALAGDAAGFAMGWSMDDVMPDGGSVLLPNIAWFVLFALLGLTRFRLRDTWQRHLVDALWVGTALWPVLAMGSESRPVGLASAALTMAGALLLTRRLWPVSRNAAVLVMPLAALAAYQAITLF
jgi:sulfoxide reductase heme-binding subunit YedZ